MNKWKFRFILSFQEVFNFIDFDGFFPWKESFLLFIFLLLLHYLTYYLFLQSLYVRHFFLLFRWMSRMQCLTQFFVLPTHDIEKSLFLFNVGQSGRTCHLFLRSSTWMHFKFWKWGNAFQLMTFCSFSYLLLQRIIQRTNRIQVVLFGSQRIIRI